MWHVATKKHEAFRAVILKALAFLTSVLKPKELRFLFDKLQTLPLKEQDKFSLGLLKAIAKVLAPNNAVLKLDKSLFKEKDDFIQGKAGLVGVKQKRRLSFDDGAIKSIVDNLEINAKTKVGNLSPISAQNPMKL